MKLRCCIDNVKNIILIGMPGAGKSTVGPKLADKLSFSFLDTDTIIREKTGRELRNIVEEDGFEAFLNIQRKIIMQQHFDRNVIATGGSVVLDEELMQFFIENGCVVYLELDIETLEERLAPGRRLARANGQTFRDMFEQRKPLYEKYADIKQICSGKLPEDIAVEIYEFVLCTGGNC